jgi:hypothetical protein
VASDCAAAASRLASIDAQSLGFISSTSAYVQYIKANEDVQVSRRVPASLHEMLAYHVQYLPAAEITTKGLYSKVISSCSGAAASQ